MEKPLPKCKVVSLQRRRASDTIKALAKLIDQARAGHVKGMVFVVKYSNTRHEPGITGDYARDRITALGAATELLHAVKQMPE